jgi:hypothetical protein
LDKAVEYQNKALAAQTFPKAQERAARRRLELHARKTPYRDPALALRHSATSPRAAKG